MLYEELSISIPKGAITGIIPCSIKSSIIFLLSFVGSPTKPISIIFSIFESLSFTSTFSLDASISLSTFPEIPIAFPPEEEIDFTISELISLESTSSTIFIVS